MNKTEIEWLQEKISYTTPSGNIITYHGDMTNIFKQAKKIEKKQLNDAYQKGQEETFKLS